MLAASLQAPMLLSSETADTRKLCSYKVVLGPHLFLKSSMFLVRLKCLLSIESGKYSTVEWYWLSRLAIYLEAQVITSDIETIFLQSLM